VEAVAQPEPPRGIYPARVDDKGRLKLPADFQKYLQDLGETKVFMTTFDGKVARIYPISVWRSNEALLSEGGEETEQAEDLWFVANDLGGDAVMDNQGRLLVPPELRRALGIENAPVRLEYYKGHFNLYSEAVYQERKARAMANLAEKLKAFEKKGLR
jgi:MraZ protein